MAAPDQSSKPIAVNRKARHDYFVIEAYEAGIELRGTEVKSVRESHISLAGGFARIEAGDVVLRNVNISPYEFGNRFNHPADRPRRLLLHRNQIHRLQVQTEQKGHTLIPLSVYLKKGLVKVELGLCKGKQRQDKRETIRRKTADMEAARAVAGARKR
jgi:SsrA-binding protein